ncbi:hypothetical protein GCM10028864_43150 [Microlunatus parietis]
MEQPAIQNRLEHLTQPTQLQSVVKEETYVDAMCDCLGPGHLDRRGRHANAEDLQALRCHLDRVLAGTASSVKNSSGKGALPQPAGLPPNAGARHPKAAWNRGMNGPTTLR